MISIDPKWEMFRGWTPYQYSFNNPMRLRDPRGERPIGAVIAFVIEHALEIGIGLIVTGYVVHQITRTEYFGTNHGLSTSVAMPPPRRFDQYAVAVISSLNAMDAVGFVDAMHAMAEEYNDSEPGEPSGDAPVPPVGGDAGAPEKTFEDILDGAEFTTKKSVKQYEKEGTYQDALDDFNAIVAPGSVIEIENGYRGELPDGRRLIVRPTSTKDLPTLEQQAPDGTSKIKLRYNPGE